MKTPHSSTNKGKRVKVTMRNGTAVVGKFWDKKSGKIILSEVFIPAGGQLIVSQMSLSSKNGARITISMKDVRAFSIYKPTK